MRRSRPRPLLALAAAALAVFSGGALAAAAGPAHPRGSRALRAAGPSVIRRMSIASPGPYDLSLAQVRLRASTASGVTLALRPRTDYVVVARRRALGRSAATLLVLVVNRGAVASTASAGRVALNVRALRTAGLPRVFVAADVYGHSTRSDATMCAGPPRRGALSPRDLSLVLAAGSPLAGFSAPAAVAQAFDAACGRPVDPRFRTAVTGGPAPVGGGPTGPTGPTGPSGPSGPTGPCPAATSAFVYRCCGTGSPCPGPPCRCCSPMSCPATGTAAEAAADLVACPARRSSVVCPL